MREGRARLYVVGNDLSYTKPFAEILSVTFDPEEADIALFTGGEDVSPELYGEPNVFSYVNENRDAREVAWWEELQRLKVPLLGICRGAQFLCVMNGGRLYQDVNGHALRGDSTHDMTVVDGDTATKVYPISSAHHQLMRPDLKAKHLWDLIGWTGNRSNIYRTGANMFNEKPDMDVDPEIVYFPETKSLCIQGHPEYMDAGCDTNKYLRGLVQRLLLDSTV